MSLNEFGFIFGTSEANLWEATKNLKMVIWSTSSFVLELNWTYGQWHVLHFSKYFCYLNAKTCQLGDEYNIGKQDYVRSRPELSFSDISLTSVMISIARGIWFPVCREAERKTVYFVSDNLLSAWMLRFYTTVELERILTTAAILDTNLLDFSIMETALPFCQIGISSVRMGAHEHPFLMIFSWCSLDTPARMSCEACDRKASKLSQYKS